MDKFLSLDIIWQCLPEKILKLYSEKRIMLLHVNKSTKINQLKVPKFFEILQYVKVSHSKFGFFKAPFIIDILLF